MIYLSMTYYLQSKTRADCSNGFTEKDESIVDHLLDYVDQNLLGSIIQSRTADEAILMK